jgi:hypothetical protein
MLTEYTWTVYVGGELYDIMTDEEVEGLISYLKITRIRSACGVIEF